MKAAILCGGFGTRLREETEFRPKPLVEVGGRPILWHIMKSYAHHGFHQFVLCLGYRADLLKEYFLNYKAMNSDFTLQLGDRDRIRYHGSHGEQDLEVTLSDTGFSTMTGGRIRRIQRYIGDDPTFLVTYGDGICDVDISAVVDFHRAHGKLATLTSVRPTSRFGVLDVGDTGKVEAFREKPSIEGWVNAGYFVFQREVFDYLDGDDCVLEQRPLERLASEGQLMAYRHEGFFFAMDTYREFKLINEMYARGERPWAAWETA